MDKVDVNDLETKKMIADYMEAGYLENIIDMFKHDVSLYSYVGELLTDERMRVRIGITALLEEMKKEDSENVKKALPFIIPLLNNQNPTNRGDAAYLLGIIGDKDSVPHLEKLLEDEDPNVRLIAKEAIEELETKRANS
jgi:HEAT repeat protein